MQEILFKASYYASNMGKRNHWFLSIIISLASLQVNTIDMFSLFKPFQTMVWIAAAVVFVSATLCYSTLEAITAKFNNKQKKKFVHLLHLPSWYIVQIWLSQCKPTVHFFSS